MALKVVYFFFFSHVAKVYCGKRVKGVTETKGEEERRERGRETEMERERERADPYFLLKSHIVM